MPKVYFLAYTKELGTFQEVKDCLDSLPEVFTWRKEIPNTFFISSDLSPEALARTIKDCLKRENPRFFLAEINMSNKRTAGWLSSESWAFIDEQTSIKLP